MTLLLEWALGYALSKAVEKTIKAAGGGPLRRDLENAVEIWKSELPERARLDSIHSLFPGRDALYQLAERPALRALRQTLVELRMPSESQWSEALLEQWRIIGSTIPAPQPFFLIPEQEAGTLIAGLSSQLRAVTVRHEAFFNSEAMALLQQILAGISQLEDLLQSTQRNDRPSLFKLLIEWAQTMYAIDPLYRSAMRNGDPWPGESIEIVKLEYKLHLSIRAELDSTDPKPAALIASVEELRQMDEKGTDLWHSQVRSLLEDAARFEKARASED